MWGDEEDELDEDSGAAARKRRSVALAAIGVMDEDEQLESIGLDHPFPANEPHAHIHFPDNIEAEAYSDDESEIAELGLGSRRSTVRSHGGAGDWASLINLSPLGNQRLSTVGLGKRYTMSCESDVPEERFSHSSSMDAHIAKLGEELVKTKEQLQQLKDELQREKEAKLDLEKSRDEFEEALNTCENERQELEEFHRHFAEHAEDELNQVRYDAAQREGQLKSEMQKLSEELAEARKNEEATKHKLATARWHLAGLSFKKVAPEVQVAQDNSEEEAMSEVSQQLSELQTAMDLKRQECSIWEQHAKEAAQELFQEKRESGVLVEELHSLAGELDTQAHEATHTLLKLESLQEEYDVEIQRKRLDSINSSKRASTSFVSGALALEMRPNDQMILDLNTKVDELTDEYEAFRSYECEVDVMNITHSCEVECLQGELKNERSTVIELDGELMEQRSLSVKLDGELVEQKSMFTELEEDIQMNYRKASEQCEFEEWQDAANQVLDDELQVRLRDSLDDALVDGELAEAIQAVSGEAWNLLKKSLQHAERDLAARIIYEEQLANGDGRLRRELEDSSQLIDTQCQELTTFHQQFVELTSQCEQAQVSMVMIERASEQLDAKHTATISALRTELRDDDAKREQSIMDMKTQLSSELKSSAKEGDATVVQAELLDMQIALTRLKEQANHVNSSKASTLQTELIELQSELSECQEWQVSACELVGCQCKELGLLREISESTEARREDTEAQLKLEVSFCISAVEMQEELASAVEEMLKDRKNDRDQLDECREEIDSLVLDGSLARQDCEDCEEKASEMESGLREELAHCESELLATALEHENALSSIETLSADRSLRLEDLQKSSEDVARQLKIMEDRELTWQSELATCAAECRMLRREVTETAPVLDEMRCWSREEASALHVEAGAAANAEEEAVAALRQVDDLQHWLRVREMQLQRIQALMGSVRQGYGNTSDVRNGMGGALLGSPFTERSVAYTVRTDDGESSPRLSLSKHSMIYRSPHTRSP